MQATVADNLLQQDFIQRPEYAVALETQLVLGLGLCSAPAGPAVWSGVGRVATRRRLPAPGSGSVRRLMATNGVFISPLFPTMGLVSALAAMTVARFTIERQRADQAGAGERRRRSG